MIECHRFGISTMVAFNNVSRKKENFCPWNSAGVFLKSFASFVTSFWSILNFPNGCLPWVLLRNIFPLRTCFNFFFLSLSRGFASQK